MSDETRVTVRSKPDAMRMALVAFEEWAQIVIPMLERADHTEAADFGLDRIAQSQTARTSRWVRETDR